MAFQLQSRVATSAVCRTAVPATQASCCMPRAAGRPYAVPIAVALAQPSEQRSRRAVVAQAATVNKAAPSTVKIVIQGRKLEVTDAIRSYIQDKLSKAVSNFAHTLKEVDVTVSARGGDTGTHGKKEQKVDVTIFTLRNGVVRVEESESTLYAAIDLVCDKIRAKLQKVKEKAIAKGKWPGKAGPKESSDDAEYEASLREFITETRDWDKQESLKRRFDELNKHFPAEVLRTKVVELDPMTVDEAIDAMEAVGHAFFVFREMESDVVQVVYKREANGYGVLIPRKRD